MIWKLLRPAVFLAFVAVIVRVESMLGIALGLAIWLVTAWWVPRQAVRTVEVKRSHPGRVMWGDEVEIEMTANVGSGMRWLAITDVTPLALGSNGRYVVGPVAGERIERTRTVIAKRRGLHTIGPTLLETGDLFSIGSHTRQVGGVGRLLVYPQIVAAAELPVTPESPLPVLPVTRPLFFDPHRVRGVRDYQVGDSLRSIHWTASASVGSLVVKELEPAISQDVVISLDMAQASHPRSGRHRSGELAVIAAASLLHHYVTIARQPVGVRIAGVDAVTGDPMDVDRTPDVDHPHLMDALEMLARVRLHRDRDSHTLLDPFGLGFGTTVIHAAGKVDERQVSDLIDLRRRGASVHVVLTGGAPDPQVAAVLAAERIGVAIVDRSSDLAVEQ